MKKGFVYMAGQYNLVVEYNKPLLQTHQDENLCQYWNVILPVCMNRRMADNIFAVQDHPPICTISIDIAYFYFCLLRSSISAPAAFS